MSKTEPRFREPNINGDYAAASASPSPTRHSPDRALQRPFADTSTHTRCVASWHWHTCNIASMYCERVHQGLADLVSSNTYSRITIYRCRFSLHPPDGLAKGSLSQAVERNGMRLRGTMASDSRKTMPTQIMVGNVTRLSCVVRT